MSTEKKNQQDSSFTEAMRDVKPLKPSNRIEPVSGKTPAIASQRARDEQSVLDELLDYDPLAEAPESGEPLVFLRPGYQKRVLKQLKQGRFSRFDSIDLHHMDEKTARSVLLDFLSNAINSDYSCVRVIHGKGLRSRGLPRLKIMTASVLRRHPCVIAYSSCRPVDGGTGATDVLLKFRQPS